jgi:glutathione synthase/RimK-type ligase-like ATP-grasp enzyme
MESTSALSSNNKINYTPQEQQPKQEEEQQPQIRLVDVPITNENTALNVMVGFLNLANRRGAFTIDESAKIWECIEKFKIIKN